MTGTTRPDIPAVPAACPASTPADGIMVSCEVDGDHERHRGTYVHELAGEAWADAEVSWLTDEPAAAVADAAAPAVTSPAPASADRSVTATGPAGGSWRERAERAEARLAEIEDCAPAIVDSLRHALAYVEHVPGPSSQAAAGRYRSALAIIGTGEDVRGGAYDVWGADFGIVGGKA